MRALPWLDGCKYHHPGARPSPASQRHATHHTPQSPETPTPDYTLKCEEPVYQSIIRGESAPTVSLVIVMVVIFVVVNLLVDLLYAVLNPKVRYGANV
ncbi:MAG: hypothetical protein LBE08_01955 [Bifidobacteriaceae bacterium]|jgi:hypothetical protein|nr:hypothetical protein [Bifidobacteriaceae bacterium]